MMHIASVLIFFVSVFFGPWWLMSATALFLLAEWRDWVSVVLGAFILDSIFGVPPIGGLEFPFLYTAFFSVLILVEFYLRSRILG